MSTNALDIKNSLINKVNFIPTTSRHTNVLQVIKHLLAKGINDIPIDYSICIEITNINNKLNPRYYDISYFPNDLLS